MGKVDDMRKAREARYEAQHPSKSGKGVKGISPSRVVLDEAADFPAGLCGHKGVGGKSCTRPKDHTEQSHRYK